ncbi:MULTISPECIES: helix-turn-helix transcriptional regulator [Microbacterium]|uniref:WYL domain-containing protein n=1 Tax=Microbacterium wangchenii TaxID=2541726 RepID=A0ABX5SWU2_9MICO|nr:MULTISPECIES: WYL domain-containing protein [Microbacterium]MCK6067331.1 WYL domain-containing protein [Microbacterium sp. EYE_512]QBR89727.1 WYL domain-containing protein [Microbacterium wangchenii]TXK16675.1 WYL domain-containing protein [Microbacterium wangchenii]
MRADRLIQALLLLQGRESVTAAELAEELEVSVPTARRDLQALLDAGVPIYPRVGRGGGWQLVGGARTDLTGLTGPEAFALMLRLTRVGAESEAAVRAERKMLQALPRSFRDAAERVVAATVHEGPWGRDEPVPAAPPYAQLLQDAIAAGAAVALRYRDRPAAVALIPLVVGRRGDLWYGMAAPPREGTDVADVSRMRTYRIDRIGELRVLSRPGRAPDDFSPEQAWRDMVAIVDARRGAVAATVTVAPEVVTAFCRWFGEYAVAGGGEAGGRVHVEVRAQSARALAEQLAGWSAEVEVVEPEVVRRELAAIGARLVTTYGERSDSTP